MLPNLPDAVESVFELQSVCRNERATPIYTKINEIQTLQVDLATPASLCAKVGQGTE